jgi:hypothetical protein
MMEDKTLEPDNVSYNLLLDTWACSDRKNSLETYKHMESLNDHSHVSSSIRTINAVMHAHANQAAHNAPRKMTLERPTTVRLWHWESSKMPNNTTQKLKIPNGSLMSQHTHLVLTPTRDVDRTRRLTLRRPSALLSLPSGY